MKRKRLTGLWLILALEVCAVGAAAALDPPHDASSSIDCTNCHITHHAPGGAITTIAGNPNLCISCHSTGGLAFTTPFANADEAMPGIGGTSHRWDSGAAGWVKTNPANTSPGTVKSGGSYSGRYRKTYTITITTAGDVGTALFSWATSNLVGLTYLDSFASVAYSGSNGTESWAASPWQEIVEADGAAAGFIQVVANAACAGGDCLRIGGGAIATRAIQRSANVSGGTAATLTFSYRRQLGTCPNTSTANVGLQVSTNGTTWATLATYNLNNCDAVQVAQVFDLTPYVSAATRIRFLGVGTAAATDFIYIDDAQIQYLVSGRGAVNLTAGANVALDDGITVAFANATPTPSFRLNDQWTIFASADINQPTTPALAARMTGGVATCSTCHNEHSQAAEPFDRAAPAYPVPGPGGVGRHYQRTDDDINQMCVDCHSARNVTAAAQGSHPVGVAIPATGPFKNP